MWRVGFDVLLCLDDAAMPLRWSQIENACVGKSTKKEEEKAFQGNRPRYLSPVGFYHTFISYLSLFTTILRCTAPVTPCWDPLSKTPLPISPGWKAPLQIGRMCKNPPPGRIRGPPTSSFLQPNLNHQRTILHDRRRGGFSWRVSSFPVA